MMIREKENILTPEEFITPETALLAKQAGFDWECRYYTSINGDMINTEYMSIDEFDLTKLYKCPTQSLLQRWLREVKNIVIIINFNNDKYCEENERYGVTIYIEKVRIVELATYPTYEEALEAGLQKCLTLIIEKQ